MKILVAKNAGFCFGVKKAVNILEKKLTENKNIFTFGDLIHNPQFINRLKEKGVGVKEEISEIKKVDTIIIRSHGVSDKVIEEIRSQGANVVDGTCPFVKNAQFAALRLEKDGYSVFVIGDKNHPEVKGILGNLKNGEAISDFSEIENELPKKVGLLSQTTLNRSKFEEIILEFKQVCEEVKVVDTICKATKEKQEEAKEIAQKADIFIVIGGKNSSNTKQLKGIGEKITRTFHIEEAVEIQEEWFDRVNTVGITAGASTPDYLIEEVIQKIGEFSKTKAPLL